MKKWGIVAVVTVLFILSVIAGFMVNSFIKFSKGSKKENGVVLADELKQETVDTGANDVVVSPNAEVILTQYFKRCGHTITTTEMAPREIVNLGKDKVQEYYRGWDIDEFSANRIKLSIQKSGICGEHYILRESDGFISISCKNDSGEYIFKGLTDIAVQYLPQEDLNQLERGIEIVGRENLNKYLENFE